MAGTMLDCVHCGDRKWLVLEAPKVEELKSKGATRLRCGICNRETDWKFADYSRRSVLERREDPAPPVFQPEHRSNHARRQSSRRKHERAPLRLPIRIRVNNLTLMFSEVTTTINVSRTGVYIQSAQKYTEGLRVRITLNYSLENAGTSIEQLGEVVRVESDPKTSLNRVSIRFL